MKQNNTNRKKLKLPRLHPAVRIILYIVMIVCFVWTMYIIRYPSSSGAVNGTAYVAGTLSLVAGMMYLIKDLTAVWKKIAVVLRKNEFMDSLFEDIFKRTIFFTLCSTVLNAVYAIMNLYTAARISSQWFFSFGIYYAALCMIRFSIMHSWKKNTMQAVQADKLQTEQKIYYYVSMALIFLGVVIGGITVLLLYSGESYKEYPGNMIISFSMSSPLMTILRRVGYIDACVSLLTLQIAMIAAFGNLDGNFAQAVNLMTGGLTSLMTFGFGWYGVRMMNKKIRRKS